MVYEPSLGKGWVRWLHLRFRLPAHTLSLVRIYDAAHPVCVPVFWWCGTGTGGGRVAVDGKGRKGGKGKKGASQPTTAKPPGFDTRKPLGDADSG